MLKAPAVRARHVEVRLSAEDAARLEYAGSYAAQGPFGTVSPALLRKLEGWARRRQPIRARLDTPTLQALLALAPLFEAYREHRRETETLFWRAAPPPDEAATALEAKLHAALARLPS
jgi:hypothetical protein